MINIDDRILDEYNANELYLLLKIAKRMRNNRTAWPSMKTLMSDTGWSKPTILKVRKSLEGKGAISIEKRQRANGSDTSNEYEVTANGIGVYVELKDVKKGGKENLPQGVKKVDPLGVKKIIPPEKVNKKEEENKENFIQKIPDLKKRIGKHLFDALIKATESDENLSRLKFLNECGKFELLLQWLEYRNDRKKKLTSKGILILVAKFEKYDKESISVAIEKSIESNYTGLFIKPVQKQIMEQPSEPPKDAHGNDIKYKPQGNLKGYAKILALRDKTLAQKAAQ